MRPDPGSFRDPDSRVVHGPDGRIFRELSARGAEDFAAFAASSLFGDPRVIGTRQAGEALLEHDRVPFVSYPYEWPFGMLKAAALLQLDLLDAALDQRLSLKDATPYNVQFEGARPVFIDVGSFERLRPDEPWVGYRQFCALFLYPLMLTAYRGVSFQPWLRGSLEGIEPADAAALLPRRRGVTVNARLLARLERRHRETSARATTSQLARAGFKPEIIRANVRKLRKIIHQLEWDVPRTAWTDYKADREKLAFVTAAAERVGPALAWDLGANDGTFAKAIAPHAGTVVAMDADHATVEQLYRSLDGGNVLPLVADLCDLSPARGWKLAERGTLTDRGRPGLTLSLALIHHLVITRNVPMAEVLGWLASLGGTHVIEFPHRDDPMVQRLISAKRSHDTRPEYDREPFESSLNEQFEVHQRLELGTRTAYEAVAK
ncbi:MAG: hypothetical protein WKF94_18550 [Solirubrobacteraceae bacterium]